jgi:hypothetical protein
VLLFKSGIENVLKGPVDRGKNLYGSTVHSIASLSLVGHPIDELSEIIFILIENDSLTLDQSLGFSFLGNFLLYYVGRLECVGHSFAYVAHFVILVGSLDVWIRTQRACHDKQGALPT